jgi:S-disulfanyl-L-cysteine oxidoreductase SoxD
MIMDPMHLRRIKNRMVALIFVWLAAAGAAQAQQRSVWAGVFTVEQSARGKIQYDAHCAVCHGTTLSGTDTAPQLSGGLFVANWDGLSAGDLFNRVHTTMPANDPGSLSDAVVTDLIAYLFMMNKFPAGSTELPRDVQTLQQIAISVAAH